MKTLYFLYCPFTGLGKFQGYRGEKWLKNRIQIFKQFVLPALLNQSSKEFILWISWRLEEKTNPIVKDFKRLLDGIRDLRTVFTYGGCFFWDDKYEDKIARERLLNSLTKTLPELKPYVNDCEFVAVTIQPSDDLYSYNFVERISNCKLEEKAIQYLKGYIIDYNTKRIRNYDPETTPPFYTIFFKRETFLDPQKHFEYAGKIQSHEYVKDHIPTEFWDDRGFVVGCHGENISTYFDHPYAGQEITGSEKERIMLYFGIKDSPLLKIKKGFKRKLFNKLPHQLQRKLRHYNKKIYDFILS